jgi:hypothetical protein
MEVIPTACSYWGMTLNNVIEISNENNTEGNKKAIFSHQSYLSNNFGSLTYEQITKNFIKEYSRLSFEQIVINRNYEIKKSKVLYDYLACQLLVYKPEEENKFNYIAKLIQEIRKYLMIIINHR